MDIRPSIFARTLTCSLAVSGVAFSQETRTKVILDADMVELFDDGTAMLLLERAPNIDLLGVTVVSGNTPMPAGVAAGARQLEALGSEVPIYEGSRYGIRNWRGNKATPRCWQLNCKSVLSLAGAVIYGRMRATTLMPTRRQNGPTSTSINMARPRPISGYMVWRIRTRMATGTLWIFSSRPSTNIPAVKLVAIGPLTNIARAILKDPSFPSKVAEIVYMGGAFYVPGIRRHRLSSTGGQTLKPPRSASARNGAIRIPNPSRHMAIR